jgi:hypothetical protein
MDEQLFRKKLSEVATWQIPEVNETAGELKKRRGKQSNEERYQQNHEQEFLELFSGKNPTYPLQLDAIKKTAEQCGDCGAECPDGRKKDFKYCQGKKKSIWREKCLNCSKYKNPYTGQFNMDSNRSQSAINSYVNGTNPDNTVYSIFELNSKEQT